jgi:hypothetical protein
MLKIIRSAIRTQLRSRNKGARRLLDHRGTFCAASRKIASRRPSQQVCRSGDRNLPHGFLLSLACCIDRSSKSLARADGHHRLDIARVPTRHQKCRLTTDRRLRFQKRRDRELPPHFEQRVFDATFIYEKNSERPPAAYYRHRGERRDPSSAGLVRGKFANFTKKF